MVGVSCTEFLEALSSKEPVPGGGGACAYNGALGISLGSMVGNLTLGNKKYEDVYDQIRILLSKSDILQKDFIALVGKDAEAFFPLANCYGLPKSTEEEKRAKDNAMQVALMAASKVPMQIAECCGRGIDLMEEYAKIGTRIAISDVGVGVYFLKAALLGAKLNVKINTKLMKNETLKTSIELEVDMLAREYEKKADAVFAYVESIISGE